jgi:hypothetical protein
MVMFVALIIFIDHGSLFVFIMIMMIVDRINNTGHDYDVDDVLLVFASVFLDNIDLWHCHNQIITIVTSYLSCSSIITMLVDNHQS